MRALLIVLVLCGTTSAQATLPASSRVPNQEPGYCFWACAETMARAQGISRLHGLLESRKSDPDLVLFEGGQRVVIPNCGGCMEAAVSKFSSLGYSKYVIRQPGKKDRELVTRAVSQGKGVLVHVIVWTRSGRSLGAHAVVLLDYGERHVKYWDPNHADREYLWDDRDSFDRAWDGFAVVLD